MILPLLALIVFLGVYPKPALDRIEPSVKALLEHVEERTGKIDDIPAPVAGKGEGAAAAAESEEGH